MQSPDQKLENRERLLHDLKSTPGPRRRHFLLQAAAGLAAAGSTAPAAPADVHLKITDLKSTILRVNDQDWTTLVEVRTNQGAVGYGQTSFRENPRVLVSVLDNILRRRGSGTPANIRSPA